MGQERNKSILDPNSVHTRPGGANSEKKNSKKIEKIKKHLSGIIFSQNEVRLDEIGRERDKRIVDPNSTHTRPEGENSEKKNSKKILKIKKQLSGVIFNQNRMRQAEKERK